jgi:hypothetical protein
MERCRELGIQLDKEEAAILLQRIRDWSRQRKRGVSAGELQQMLAPIH